MCARAEQKQSRQIEIEIEIEVCARAWKARPHAAARFSGNSRRLNKVWSLFFLGGKKSLKGSAMLPSWQHCASTFLKLWVRTAVKPAAL